MFPLLLFPVYFHFLVVAIQTLCSFYSVTQTGLEHIWRLSSTIKVLYIVQNLQIIDGGDFSSSHLD